MLDRLTAEIERVRSDKSIPTLDEASVKQGVILRILNALGWDTFDIEEVKPEHSVGAAKSIMRYGPMAETRCSWKRKGPTKTLATTHNNSLTTHSERGCPWQF